MSCLDCLSSPHCSSKHAEDLSFPVEYFVKCVYVSGQRSRLIVCDCIVVVELNFFTFLYHRVRL